MNNSGMYENVDNSFFIFCNLTRNQTLIDTVGSREYIKNRWSKHIYAVVLHL